jgi:hypothetical protein
MLARTDTEPRIIAEVRDYAGLHAAFRARADELAVSRETLDDLTGLQSGYTAKLLAPVPIKRIGLQSLGPLLCVLGVRLVMLEDLDALRRMGPRLQKRRDASVRYVSARRRKKRPKLAPELARMMAARRVLTQTRKQRSQIAKRAAVIRWSVVKQVMRAAALPKRAMSKQAREARLRLDKPNGGPARRK